MLIYKFVKFGLVGTSGVAVDFAITYMLKEWGKVNKYIANSCGFVVAASTNYLLNRIWTFASHNPNVGFEYSQFLVISLVGLGINNLLIYLLSKRFKVNFYWIKLAAIAVVTVWNFVMNYLITFSQTF